MPRGIACFQRASASYRSSAARIRCCRLARCTDNSSARWKLACDFRSAGGGMTENQRTGSLAGLGRWGAGAVAPPCRSKLWNCASLIEPKPEGAIVMSDRIEHARMVLPSLPPSMTSWSPHITPIGSIDAWSD
eukprot:scaffold12165_cov102-Isochrysis_galbana.AAC.1